MCRSSSDNAEVPSLTAQTTTLDTIKITALKIMGERGTGLTKTRCLVQGVALGASFLRFFTAFTLRAGHSVSRDDKPRNIKPEFYLLNSKIELEESQ